MTKLDTATKAVEIIRGLIGLVKLGFTVSLERDSIFVLDPRTVPGLGERYPTAIPASGIVVYSESRLGRSWSDMLHSVVSATGPLVEASKTSGLLTPELRTAHDNCSDPACAVHGRPRDVEEGAQEGTQPDVAPLGWSTPVIPEG